MALLYFNMQSYPSGLQASEDLYKTQFDFNPNPMWLYDAETLRFLDVNNAATIHYGYNREEFLSMTIKDIRPVEELEKLNNVLKSKNFDYKNSGPWRHRKKNGEIIHMSITAKALLHQGRQVVFALLIDVTDKLKQEEEIILLNQLLEQKVQERTKQYHELNCELEASNEELSTANKKLSNANQIIAKQAQLLFQQSEEKLNQILNVIQNVVWSVNMATGELNYINKAALNVSGYDVEDFYANSKLLYNVILQEDKPIMKAALSQLDKEDYAEAEYRICHKSGQIRWVTNRMWLIRDKQSGKPIQMHGVVNDSTDKKLVVF